VLDLDLPALVDDPANRWATLRRTPLSGSFAMPTRKAGSFDTLPNLVAKNIPPLGGEIRVEGYLEGTVERPFIAGRISGVGITAESRAQSKGGSGAKNRPAAASDWAMPIGVEALLTYDSRKATLTAHATREGVGIATANAEIDADLHALLRPRKDGEKTPWTGGFSAQVNELQLGDIPFLGDHGVTGHVKGTISATGLNDRPVFALDLTLPDLQVGSDLSFRRGDVSIHIDPSENAGSGPYRAVASAAFEQNDGGRLDATARSAITWRDGLVPEIDPTRPADIDATVDQLRLAALFPMVSSVFSKLDGRVDGSVKIGWEGEEDEDARINVDLRVVGGEFHIPQLGQELRNARVHVRAKPGATAASTIVALEDVAAQAASGQITGEASADLQGLRFVGGRGDFLIKKGEELPITFEGVPLGNARGRILLDATKDPNKPGSEVAVTIGLRDVHLSLPDSTGRAVQPLEEHPEITPSHPIGIEKEPRSEDALRWVLTFDIAPLQIEGSGVDIKLSGSKERPPRVELSDTLHLSGDIQIDSGRVERFGKVFLIEPTDRPGLVRLRAEDASNPYLNVRAHWDAPDGSRIFVDYIGVLKPITNEKLRFTSSDGRPPDQIFQLLLFGADAAETAQAEARTDGRAGGVAVGLGGGIAAEQFNALLSGIAPLRGLSTRISTSAEGALKTTVTYQIIDTVSASATVEGASSSTGDTNQQTGAAQINVDWRFHPRWSISSKLGVRETQRDQQTTVGADLLWQYRY
jgi:translocation and assembly module TamB